ncbi:hypothetical protein CR159_08600 [Pollutimonas subterranea]|uniref:Regulatory protein, Fis family n=1 Tax=Pollutimonas subterranea TaxID=2045210 RepID=A0A2N4U646_9BURK|nr:hypothetical protein [Pollutimonas subterranea]PLC50491.1 hypothetical protein CR159_08600 [Pollutimonas subterranea]
MREYLDCAVLSTTCSTSWVEPWLDSYSGNRLQLHVLDVHDIRRPESVVALVTSSMRLRRFDACLIPVHEQNLAWARTALSAAHGVLQTPVLALARNLKAAALNDLRALGLADFIREPVCAEELRARIERLLDGKRYHAAVSPDRPGISEITGQYRESPPLARQEAICATILDRTGLELDAFAAASASQCATSKESFRAAKGKVIERFERAYITAALGRHSGNIAMAARAAQKHRRAFWALMRKHEIDATPFRGEPVPIRNRDG